MNFEADRQKARLEHIILRVFVCVCVFLFFGYSLHSVLFLANLIKTDMSAKKHNGTQIIKTATYNNKFLMNKFATLNQTNKIIVYSK